MVRVSVIMPVYNGSKYLKEAIDSILNQTFTDFEFLVVDDCSIDDSADIIKSYNDDRIKYIKNETNLGLPGSLNKAIKQANGEYIARMDADDISDLERFKKQVEFLDANKDVGVLGAWIKYIGDKDNIVTYSDDSNVLFYSFLTGEGMVAHPVVMLRKSLLIDNNLFYDEDFTSGQDYKLWHELKHLTKISNLQEVLLQYRSHDSSISSTKLEKQLNNKFKVIEKEITKTLGVEYKQCFRKIINNDFSDVDYKCFKEFLSLAKLTNKSFRRRKIKMFLLEKVKNKKLKKLIFIFYLRPFMLLRYI